MYKKLGIVAFVTLIGMPVVADAQGVVRGAREGAAEGAEAAGPVGGVVGGVTGGVVGGVAGILGADSAPRFREYVVREGRPSYRWGGRVVAGEELPADAGYYDVPAEYHVRPGYRYTVVNGRTVIVQGRRIVQVVE